MNHALLLSILLIPATIDAMEIVVNNKDIVMYSLAPLLDRQDRATLRSVNKKCATFIEPQLYINEQYTFACEKNDTKAMHELRKKGALHLHEEIYTLFLNNKKDLTAKIISHNHHNIVAIFFYGIKQLNLNYMYWLLNTEKPHYNSSLLKKSLAYSTDCSRHDSSLTSLINRVHMDQLLRNYMETESIKDLMKTRKETKDAYTEYLQKENSRQQNCIIS